MNSFWLKIAGFAVVIIALIIAVKVFTSRESEPKPKRRTFGDQIKDDEIKFRSEPKFAESNEPEQTPAPKPAPEPAPAPAQTEQPPLEKPQFKELSEIEQIDAERLLIVAIQHFKVGRLPTTGYKITVDSCRQIISKYPDSIYAFKAKRILRDIPERFRQRYNITEDEIDLGELE